MKDILIGFLALLTFSSIGFAQYYNSCESSCCEGAGGYWDSSDGTCTEPSSQSSYFSCSMNCDEETSYAPTSSSSGSCCGSVAILLAVLGAAFFSRS
ncbi:MAG: hypothetical protein V1492_00240 [Candidatus Micrarchaeota archaeon]